DAESACGAIREDAAERRQDRHREKRTDRVQRSTHRGEVPFLQQERVEPRHVDIHEISARRRAAKQQPHVAVRQNRAPGGPWCRRPALWVGGGTPPPPPPGSPGGRAWWPRGCPPGGCPPSKTHTAPAPPPINAAI